MFPTNQQRVAFRAKPVRGSVVQVSCDQAECANKKFGWKVVLSGSSQSDTVQWVRNGGTNRWYIEDKIDNDLWEFTFPAGQDCFKKHYAQDMVFDIGRFETGRSAIWYPDGDAFVGDSDAHLRKLKEAIDG